MQTRQKTNSEICLIKESGKMLATILNLLINSIDEGMSTKDVAEIAKTELQKLGGKPAFLGYQNFPDVLCVSINDEVVHGIPTPQKIIKNGDIVSLDFGVNYGGMITDGAKSIIVGNNSDQKVVDLVKNTELALYKGISVVRSGIRTGDIGYAIESELNKHNYGIVRDLVGHGVGHFLHEDPNIPNYGRKNTGPWLYKGMTIAIEPMVTLGRDEVRLAKDNWTILTADGSLAAHFEHTILITDNGSEIITQV